MKRTRETEVQVTVEHSPPTKRLQRGARSCAVLVGINYLGTSSALKGCINDVENMRRVLIDKMGFLSQDIVLMTDNTPEKPTKSNIRKALRDLAALCIGDSRITCVWFHYSGHGGRTRDVNRDEKDGMDETLCPIDYSTAGMYVDDEFRADLALFPATVRVFCVLDSCHSGTAADLYYSYTAGDKTVVENNINPNIAADIVAISGCMDTQTSADAYINGQGQGAMTAAVLDSLYRTTYSLTYFTLLKLTRAFLVNNGFSQKPQLTSSRVVNSTTRVLGGAAQSSPTVEVCPTCKRPL